MKQSTIAGSTQGVVSNLGRTMSWVLQQVQRLTQKHLFRFAVGDTVLQVLAAIAGVPLEPFDLIEINHKCILPSYTVVVRAAARQGPWGLTRAAARRGVSAKGLAS